ncbi:MAG: TrwC9, partial [Verrucomicrobiales bacterium]|nr:TrwC9 [Verrucomicrobiales bacterium]
EDPGTVFDRLAVRGQIQLHPDDGALRTSLARTAAVSFRVREAVAVVVNTREQAADLNAAVREQLVADAHVDDVDVVTTSAGQRIGAGDRIASRRNEHDLGVANRDTWVVAAVTPAGGLVVTPAAVTSSVVTPAPDQKRLLPAGYAARHVELAYASTAHGVQGETVTTAHVVVGERAGAASTYVGMSRGRTTNVAHLVGASLEEAREQWIAVFARDGADLGPGHAGVRAAEEAARYAPCPTPTVRRPEPEHMLSRRVGTGRGVAR